MIAQRVRFPENIVLPFAEGLGDLPGGCCDHVIERAQFDSNKKKIYATQTVCGICEKPVDFGFKFPHPLSPCIDHIIPVAKGGQPSDIGTSSWLT